MRRTRAPYFRRKPAEAPPDIALLSINYPPETTGIAPYSGSLATGLVGLGHRVAVHSAHPHYPGWKIEDGYGQWTSTSWVKGVGVTRRLHFVPRSPRGLRRLLSELSFGFRLALGHLGRPRIVVAVSPSLFASALVVLRLRLTPCRPPIVLWVQDIYTLGLSETGEGTALVRFVTKQVEKWTLRLADRVVVIHGRFAEYLMREFHVPEPAITTIRNWTHLPPTQPVDPITARASLGWPAGVTLAVHTGNMGAKQGLENVVDAARIADETDAPVHFLLVGDGGERKGLEQRALGIDRLTFVDPLDPAEYRLALGAADTLIVNEKPGVAAMAVPSKLTSYFDAGRPIVAATDPSGITAAEISAANAGVVVEAGNPKALLQATLAISGDQAESARFAANGRRYRELVLDESAAIEKWGRLLNELIDQG